MSRRKQQNPKPCKYELPHSSLRSANGQTADFEGDCGISQSQTETTDVVHPSPPTNGLPPESPSSVKDLLVVKDEPSSPPVDVSQQSDEPETNLASLLGVPDDAPLRVESTDDGNYKILTSKPIIKGAGLDPLRAQKIDKLEEFPSQDNNSQIVSFTHCSEKVYFLLDNSINCGWLKHLGTPDQENGANLRIYFVGGQLWVEVVKNLSENQQLIAEFCDPSKDLIVSKENSTSSETASVGAGQSNPSPSAPSKTDLQFPCKLCGISFRNPNTLMAHKKHYCSKATSSTTAGYRDKADMSPPASGDHKESDSLQSAYLCQVCKFVTLTKSDIENHVKEKHNNNEAELRMLSTKRSLSSTDKTYCEDCEIHFKKPESYLAHKQHYCKNRSSSLSPRSEAERTQNSLTQSNSPTPHIKDLYKKVSIFDNSLATTMANQAAAAAAAASLPLSLSSLLTLPAMAALPIMPLKLLQSPALIAQALQSVVKANSTLVTGGLASPSNNVEPEIPLDLTVKQELALSSSGKRKSQSDSDVSPPAKRQASSTSTVITSNPNSPKIATSTVLPINAQFKSTKPERPIYRCESCSIPFYKKDVYEAHKLHYCSQRSSNSSEQDEERTTPRIPEPQVPATTVPSSTVADERLVITYTCNKCSTSYRTIETFKAHQCSVPESTPELRCEECNFTTQSKQILQEHMETHQKSNVIFKCSICGYHGNTMRGMRQHGRQHMLKGEEFLESDVIVIESPAIPQKISIATNISLPSNIHKSVVDEELLRLKNEPYKKRRSRKHYQKSEYITQPADNTLASQQRKENNMQRQSSLSPQSSSTNSCTSPLQTSTTNVPSSEVPLSPPSTTEIKKEPKDVVVVSPQLVEHVASSSVLDKKALSVRKNHICSCNASFASAVTFEAHKKHYCPHNKSKQTNPTITVTH